MEVMPWLWISLAMIFNVAIIGCALWLVWVLVTAIRGIHSELMKIREIVARMGPAGPAR